MGPNDNFAFLLPIMMLSFGAAFLIVGRWNSVPARAWGCGYIINAMAFSVPMALGWLPTPVQAMTANALFLAGFYCFGEALLLHFGKAPLHFGKAPLRRSRIAFCLLAYAAVTHAVLVRRSLHAELLVSDLSCAMLLVVPLLLVVRTARQPVDRLLVLVVSLIVVETLVRTAFLETMLSSGDGLDGFFSSRYAFYMQVGASIISVIVALTALASVVLRVVERYRRAAEQDPLTGLLNRRGFDTAVATVGEHAKGAVITCDIDHFKRVNDAFGHAAGDRVIVGFAQLLRSHLPVATAVARFGGEEFVAYLPTHTRVEAGLFANSICLAFAAQDWRDIGVGQQITASFGVSAPAAGDLSLHDAVSRADASLYAAKAAGRNKVMMDGKQPVEIPGLRIISVA